MKQELTTQLTTALLSCPIVYIPHFHYEMLDATLIRILCPKEGHGTVGLDVNTQVIEYDGGQNIVVDFINKRLNDDFATYADAVTLIKDFVTGRLGDGILLLKNFAEQIQEKEVQSLLASFATHYEQGKTNPLNTVIIMSPQPVNTIPLEISRFVTAIDIKAPTEDEIMEEVMRIPVSERYKGLELELRLDLCHTLQGLQMYEVKQILHSALIRTGGRLSMKTKQLALEEKKSIVRKSGVIEVVDTDVTFRQIGGLDVLKDDLIRKASIYRNLSLAQKYHVALPKGVLIIGMPGCGKSMIAKSIASEFGVSLLRLDINRLMGQYVGQSEANLRSALATAEAAHPCVLWIDEIEKAFAGSNGQNNDMLVMRLMGHFLTWMQERKTPVYIVATANDVMRPEFMRKGRFDEVYFVDFPNEKERKQIFQMKISRFINDAESIFDFSEVKDIDKIVNKDNFEGKYGGFSGAEIESVVNTVIEKKFVEYLKILSDNNNQTTAKIRLKEQDFIDGAESIKDAVMANQKSREYEEYKKHPDRAKNEHAWTNIERIKEMQEKYKFTPATNKSK